MKDQYLEFIRGLVEGQKELDSETMQKFMGETLKYFQDLQKRAASEDALVKEEATREATEAKEALQKVLETLCKKMGIDPSHLGSWIANTEMFENKNKEIFDRAKQERKELETSSSKRIINKIEKINI